MNLSSDHEPIPFTFEGRMFTVRGQIVYGDDGHVVCGRFPHQTWADKVRRHDLLGAICQAASEVTT